MLLRKLLILEDILCALRLRSRLRKGSNLVNRGREYGGFWVTIGKQA
jgi:hypothetical protein